MCIKDKVKSYCTSNADDFKCKIFERCKGTPDQGDKKANLLAKKQCVKDFCEEPSNEGKFECLALECRQKFLPLQKLICMNKACANNEDKQICQKISACQAENQTDFSGVLKVFECLKSSIIAGRE